MEIIDKPEVATFGGKYEYEQSESGSSDCETNEEQDCSKTVIMKASYSFGYELGCTRIEMPEFI